MFRKPGGAIFSAASMIARAMSSTKRQSRAGVPDTANVAYGPSGGAATGVMPWPPGLQPLRYHETIPDSVMQDSDRGSTGNPEFSVIIPTFNRAHVLPRAIDSVLRQSHGDFELLVVDDGSTDGTAQCIASYRDARIRYIRHEHNRGQNPALNTGLEAARGTFVSFLDSDDAWDAGMLETVLAKFRSDEELGWVYTAYRVQDAEGLVLGPLGGTVEGWVYAEALEQGHVSPPTTLSVRRTSFGVVGGFDLDIVVGQDDVMCLKLARAFKVGRVDAVLATLHWDGGMRLSDDVVGVADGYYALHERFSADTLALCGRATLARHYAHAGTLFLNAGRRRMAVRAYVKCLTRGWSAAAVPRLGFSLLPRLCQDGIRHLRRD